MIPSLYHHCGESYFQLAPNISTCRTIHVIFHSSEYLHHSHYPPRHFTAWTIQDDIAKADFTA